MKLKATLLSALFMPLFSGIAFADTITLNVDTASARGTVRAGVYDSQAAFDAGKLIVGVSALAKKGNTVLKIRGLKPGIYGISVFHDKNADQKLGRNFLKIPTEPYGFSTNPKVRFRSPTFDEYKFKFTGKPLEFDIKLLGN